MAPTQLSIVLERLLNELGIANLSMFEAVLMHDTGAVLDAVRSTAAAAEAGAAVYASSATSNVVVCPSSTATAGAISVQHEGSISRTLVSTDAQTTLKGSDIHAAASSATAEMLLRQELEEKLRSHTKELASEQRSANAMKKALASARDELAAAQELRRSDCDNLRTAQQAAEFYVSDRQFYVSGFLPDTCLVVRRRCWLCVSRGLCSSSIETQSVWPAHTQPKHGGSARQSPPSPRRRSVP